MATKTTKSTISNLFLFDQIPNGDFRLMSIKFGTFLLGDVSTLPILFRVRSLAIVFLFLCFLLWFLCRAFQVFEFGMFYFIFFIYARKKYTSCRSVVKRKSTHIYTNTIHALRIPRHGIRLILNLFHRAFTGSMDPNQIRIEIPFRFCRTNK